MGFKTLECKNKDEVMSLFLSVFTLSEGESEGQLIGQLAMELAARIDNQDVICIGACEDAKLIAAIFFTRLRFDEPVEAYLLSPVAVSTSHQGKGFGQALIRHGLDSLKERSVTMVMTYGDPAFYAKTGFKSLSEDSIQAPHTLSMPQGWLAQHLAGSAMPILKSRPACVPQFNNPAYW
jgi:putative acetyltransferase